MNKPNSKNSSSSHASHEACELKSYEDTADIEVISHASHEACELKFLEVHSVARAGRVTPRMRRVS